MATWAAQHGVDYLDGAIMTPTPTIGTPAASVLYSGPESIFKVHQPTLASLGGTTSYLGADRGRAAAYDVALLDLFWTSMSGYAHALALATAENIPAKEFAIYARYHRHLARHHGLFGKRSRLGSLPVTSPISSQPRQEWNTLSMLLNTTASTLAF